MDRKVAIKAACLSFLLIAPAGFLVGTTKTNIPRLSSQKQSGKKWLSPKMKRVLIALIALGGGVAAIAGGIALYKKVTGINKMDKYGNTQLHRAVSEGHTETVQALLAKGAIINMKNHRGQTALHIAASNVPTDQVNALIAAGANVKEQDNNGLTALHFAVWLRNTDVANVLIAAGADVNAKTTDGATPLLLATSKGYTEVVKTLIGAGADVNAKEEFGCTPLLLATYYGHIEVVNILLDAGADVNVQGLSSSTPLHLAAYKGSIEMVKALTPKHTADTPTTIEPSRDQDVRTNPLMTPQKIRELILMKNNKGKTALDLAKELGYTEIEEWLQEHIQTSAI